MFSNRIDLFLGTRFLIVFLCLSDGVAIAEEKVEIQSLTENVLVVTGGKWESNLTAISVGDNLVVVDTYDTPGATAAALESVRKAFPGKSIRYLINTHGHDDHVWGNEILHDVPTIAHKKAYQYMIDRKEKLVPFFSGERIRELEGQLDSCSGESVDEIGELRARLEAVRAAHERWGEVRITLPSIVIDSSLTLHLDGGSIEVLHPGGAHSLGDLVVFVPDERVLLVGDLVGQANEMRSFDGEQGNVVDWLGALEELQSRFAGRVSRVVPGHGRAVDMATLEATREYLAYVVEQVMSARHSGCSLEDAKRGLKLEKLIAFEGFEELRENNIEATWHSLNRGHCRDGD